LVADLQPVTFPSPGFLGINKEARQTLLAPAWATEAQNGVVDSAGRIAARKGWTNETSTAISGTPLIQALHEFIQDNGTKMLIAGANNKLWHSVNDGDSWVDKTALLTVTANKWQFVNFNGRCFAAQIGHDLLGKTTTGDFAAQTASSGTIPNDPVAILSAFGRLWAIDSTKQTLKYCALLDETLWAEADGGGEVDLKMLWTQGTDEGVAVAAFGSTLVVFGRRHIILFTDGRGSDRGLDPSQMYVFDTIEGQGCAARDSVQTIGEGDLMWLSQTGIRSIARVLQENATEIGDATGNNQSYVIETALDASVDSTEIRSVYSPENKFYLLTMPDASNTFCIDMRSQLEDGSRRMTEWTGFTPGALCRRVNGDLLFGFSGVVGKYAGYNDNDTLTYRFVFRSGWIDQGEANALLKIPKRMKVLAYAPAAATVTLKWFFDFKRYLNYAQATFSGDALDEFDVGEYGTAQYSSALAQRDITVPMSGSGQYILVGIELEVDGQPFALQSMTIYQVPGRLA
jgi:hypothetical protein